MPITRRQFEIGIDEKLGEWMRKIYDFFVKYKDAAFTFDEVWKAFYADKEPNIKTGEGKLFYDALDKLVELAAVEKRLIGDKFYYACGFVPLEI